MPSPTLNYHPRSWKPRAQKTPGSSIDKSKMTLVVLALIAVGIIVSFVAYELFSRDLPDPNKLIDRDIPETTKLYDKTGETLLYEVHGAQRRTLVSLDQIPEYAKKATITTEDRNFYSHGGISITGILRAVLIDVFTGSRKQGGSTITQQFIKNAVLTRDKSFVRKIKEIVLSYELEKKFTKDQILQFYLNEIPYGSSLYGIESASQAFFGVSAKDLTLEQAALLAAIPKAPTYYSPYGSHRDDLLSRKDFILNQMADLHYITKEQADEASKKPLEFKSKREQITAPHFVQYIKEQLSQKYGETVVEQGGLKVITTLDTKLQKIAEEEIAKNDSKMAGFGASNAAMVVLDPKTGDILAMVGSKDYFNEAIDGNVNVTIRPRQPGSSFKPIVYSAAFIEGYTTHTMLYDTVTDFKTDTGKLYTPHNYDSKEHGPVSIRQALAGSLNIPAVELIYLVGIDKVLNLADKLGYSTLSDRSRFGLSLVLGGGEVKLIDHVRAFTTFANEGKLPSLRSVLKVESSSGEVLEENKEVNLDSVLDPEVTRNITSVLSDNAARAYIFGAKNYLTLPNRPVAAKTGTTNDYKDAWTIGYTPSLVAGVWVGNNNNTSMKKGADGSAVAAPIWNGFMKRALEGTPVESFTAPQDAKTGNPAFDGDTGKTTIKIDLSTGKRATEYTPSEFVIEKTFYSPHSLLYYIRPNDPNIKEWEDAVQKWAKKNNIITEEPPSETDDTHTEASIPNVSFVTPREGDSITSHTPLTIEATSPRGVQGVEILLDGAHLTTLTTAPYMYTLSQDTPLGKHTLSAIARDDTGNKSQVYITVDVRK